MKTKWYQVEISSTTYRHYDIKAESKEKAEELALDAVDEDWRKSHQYGVTGVPTFVASGHGVVGAQPYEALETFLESLGV